MDNSTLPVSRGTIGDVVSNIAFQSQRNRVRKTQIETTSPKGPFRSVRLSSLGEGKMRTFLHDKFSMRLAIIVILFFSSMFYSCATTICNRQLVPINKVIIDVQTENIMLAGTQVGDGYGSIPSLESIKNMTLIEIEGELEDRFKNELISKRLEISRNDKCSNGAVLVTNNMTYIEHHMGKYSAEIRTKITNCSSGNILFMGKRSAQNRAFSDTPHEFGENIANDVYKALTVCK